MKQHSSTLNPKHLYQEKTFVNKNILIHEL